MMRNLALFPEIGADAPRTEGIKYAGSKLKLLPHILELAAKVEAHTVLDGFSGTTRVAQALAKKGYRVIANDVAAWSEVFGTCYLLNTRPRRDYEQLIQHLNHLEPFDGWFTAHYGGIATDGSALQSDGLKRPWQVHNTRKLDAIRDEIDRLSLPPLERAVALASLILALDEVDSTLGHYAAYLQKWSPRSYRELALRVPCVFTTNETHEVASADIFDLVGRRPVDLAYFDPPYGSNNEKMPPSRVRYASYYHLWTTVCLHDKPELFGKAKRRRDSSDRVAASVFEEFRRNSAGRFLAVEAIDRLIHKTNARWVILSYSSGGRATAEELNQVLSGRGKILETMEIDHRRNVMADMKWTSEWVRDADQPNREFLFLLERR
jgi:adenine-specific DNA-methyltransferase